MYTMFHEENSQIGFSTTNSHEQSIQIKERTKRLQGNHHIENAQSSNQNREPNAYYRGSPPSSSSAVCFLEPVCDVELVCGGWWCSYSSHLRVSRSPLRLTCVLLYLFDLIGKVGLLLIDFLKKKKGKMGDRVAGHPSQYWPGRVNRVSCISVFLPHPDRFISRVQGPRSTRQSGPSPKTLVCGIIDQEHRNWNRGLITKLFLPVDIPCITSIPLPRQTLSDSLIWPYSKECLYIVRSGYHWLIERQNMTIATNYWRLLWKIMEA